MTGNNTLGFLLDDATFYIHTSNQHEVARFGSSESNANVRIYTDYQSNAGFIISVQRESTEIYPSFAIQGSHLATPSLYVQGNTGYLGINTNTPQAAFDVQGDLILGGQLVQTGTNQNIISETVLSSTLYVNTIYSSNVDGTIDLTNSVLSNIGDVTTQELHVEGLSITHDMGGMRRKEIAGGQYVITSVGTHELGYIIAWDGVGIFSELDMFEVSGVTYGVGVGTRMHHRFHCMINPTDEPLQGFPGLDVIAEQNSMSGPGITIQPKVHVDRISSNSVRVTSRWSSSTSGYRVSMKMDIFAPIGLGNITYTSYVI